MKQCLQNFWLFNSSILFYLLYSNATTAQIVPDATLPVNSSVTQQGNTSVIEGGTTAGTNLFHSFKEFSVPNGAEAFFNNALEIQNIFSRVTRGNISNIDGLIRANGVANLFLINPNGIIFGPNARLNIGGSFLASTASSIRFADGIEFSATNPNAPPLLTINVPIGLQYGKNAGNIQVQGNGQNIGLNGATESFQSELNPLAVLPGKTLAIAGGNIIIDGGILQAPGGRVELGAVAGEGTIGINADASLSFPDGVVRADVSIINKAGINVLAAGGGSIAIAARNIDISTDSLLSAGIAAQKGASETMAGDISLNATEAITIASSLIENNLNRDAIGNSGSINITTGSLAITGGAVLNASTFGQGKAANVNILARNTISFDGSDALSRVEKYAVGDAGGINITTESLFVTNGARLDAGLFGKGNGGGVNIVARDTVSFDGVNSNGRPTSAFSNVLKGAVGNGGQINIQAGSLLLANQARLVVNTLGQGKAGSINIQAEQLSLSSNASLQADLSETGQGRGGDINLDVKGTILLVGGETARTGESTRISLGVLPGGTGSGGNLIVDAGSLVLKDGAIIKVSTQGQGDAGSITINADLVEISGSVPKNGLPSGLFTSTATSFKAGDIIVNVRRFHIADGAALSTRSKGDGQGGNIKVNATSTFEAIKGGQLVNTTFGKGQAGNIFINATDQVIISGSDANYTNRIAKFPNPISPLVANAITETGAASGLFANTETNSTGQGGGIRITTGQLIIQDGGQVTVNSQGSGNAGNVEALADSIRLDNRATVSSDTTGGEGDINLRSRSLILRRNSSITTDATGSKEIGGGNITLNAQVLAALENSDITANAQEGKGGEITINADAIFGSVARTRDEIQLLLNPKDANSINPRQLLTSDITAISQQGGPQLQGTVTVNTPDVDPSSGLIELPIDFVDPTRLIAQGCPSNRGNSFTVTGRGGLPPSPNDPLRANNTVSPSWVTRDSSSREAEEQVSRGAGEIVEATGWIINQKGQVVLIASRPNTTHDRFLLTPSSCPETVESR